jgi:folate-binding protein YgfZ
MFFESRVISRLARARALVTPWNGVPGLGALLATGRDVEAFLQAQLTSDVRALEPGSSQVSTRLDSRGKLTAWFHLLRLPERGQSFPSFLLVLPATQVEILLADLRAYVIAEDVSLEDISRDFSGLLVQGPESSQLQDSLEDHLPPGTLSWPLSLTGDPGQLILLPGAGEDAAFARVLNMATAAGWSVPEQDEVFAQAWRWLTMEAGWPALPDDFEPGSRLLPQTGLEQQAVSYSKGCFLGQEVVARVRTYGSVPEAMRALVFPGCGLADLDGVPAPGEPLLDERNRRLGTWGRTAWSDGLDEPFALVFLKRDHRTPGLEFQVRVDADDETECLEARVALLPLHSAGDARARAEQLHHQAVAAFGNGEDERAVNLLEEALRLVPDLADAHEALGVILGRAERYHEAIDIFRRLEEVAPDEPMVHTNLSLFYMKVGDREEAERQKALAARKRGSENEAAPLGGVAPATPPDGDPALINKQAMFAEVLEIDPEDPLALMGMGNVLIDLGQPAEADRYLARALAVQKDNSALYLSRGKLLQELGREGEAASVLRKGIEVASKKGDLMPLREMEARLVLSGASVDEE